VAGTIRVVSLVPSITETLLAWGVTPVACTRFCEQPQLDHVGGTKDPDLAAIEALTPDIVVMDTEENRIEDHEALVAAGVAVHATSVRSMDDLRCELPALAALVEVRWEPPVPVDPPATRLTAFVPIWKRPWMALGSPAYGTSLLESIGIVNVLSAAGPYPEVSFDDVIELAPDIVVAPDEPYPFGERHRAQLEQVAPVVFVDGRDLLWWGARTPAAARRLAAALTDPLSERDDLPTT
jgi:ABC-type Fe3+-hydroxamate transport system substrate-binding protein